MRLFLSYASKDSTRVQPLVDGLRVAGHAVWVDEDLRGGVEWWQTILQQIREADAIVAVASSTSLSSPACSAERSYGFALGKPMLPVLVEAMSIHLLPTELSQLQLVDFVVPDMAAAFRLAGAVAGLPPAPPLPDELPAPPLAPLSYLSEISRQAYAPSLTRDEQLMVIAHLREALHDPDDREDALRLVTVLSQRDDLLAVAERQLRELSASISPTVETIAIPAQVPAPTLSPPSPPPPPPAVPDPTQRRLTIGSTLVTGLSIPGDLAVVGTDLFAISGSPREDCELISLDLATATVSRRTPSPQAFQVEASPGGVLISTQKELVARDLTLRSTGFWKTEGTGVLLAITATRNCGWALLAENEKSVNPRMSVGRQFDVSLVRMHLATGAVDLFPLGPDTFWTSPLHFRGLMLHNLEGPSGQGVAVIRSEWSTPGLGVKKSKVVTIANETSGVGPSMPAGTFVAGSAQDADADLRQITSDGERLLLTYEPVPGTKGSLAVAGRDLSGRRVLHEYAGPIAFWVDDEPGPVGFAFRTRTSYDVFRLEPSGQLRLCGTVNGDVYAASSTYATHSRQLSMFAARGPGELWWRAQGPGALMCLHHDNRIERVEFEPPGWMVASGPRYVACYEVNGGYEIAEVTLST